MIPKLFLQSVDLFKGLTTQELEKIEKCCEEVTLGNDTIVFRENDPAQYLYALVDGKVSLKYTLPSKRESRDNRVASIHSGDAFGWSSVQGGDTYTLTAYCSNERCIALRINKDALNELMDNDHSIGYKVMKNLSQLIADRFIALQKLFIQMDGQNDIDGW